jgi:putative flippase GtrA
MTPSKSPNLFNQAKSFFRNNWSRFLKFGSVGALGVVVNMAFYTLFHEYLEVEDYLSRIFAIEIAVLHNFTWNFFWTWKDRGRRVRSYFTRILRYHGSTFIASYLVPLLIGWLVNRILVSYPFANYISHLTGIVAGMMVNYIISDLWVFRGGQKTNTAEQDSK